MKFVLLSLVFFSLNLRADFKKMANEWAKENIDIVTKKDNVIIQSLEFENIAGQRTWTLGYDFNTTKSDQETSTTTVASTNTDYHILSLTKEFNWGGELAFSNNLYSYGNSTSYQFAQGLTYTQSLGADLFGRSFKKNLEIATENSHLAKLEYDEAYEQGLLNLLTYYTRVSLNKSLIKYQKEAQARADRRLNIIKRWVRDGLREKVDLFQAQAALLSQEENVKLAQIELQKNIRQLASTLHREIKENEVDYLMNTGSFVSLEIEEDDNQNKNLQVLKSRMKVLEARHQKAKMDVMPTVALSLGWESNDYDKTRSETLSNGSIGNDRDEVSIGLSASWAIGNISKSAQRDQAAIRYKLAERKVKKYRNDLREAKKSLSEQVKILANNVASTEKRVALNKKALGQYNRLYQKGRADLDQVIRSEETLIQSEISLVRQKADYQTKLGELNFVQGTIIPAIFGN